MKRHHWRAWRRKNRVTANVRALAWIRRWYPEDLAGSEFAGEVLDAMTTTCEVPREPLTLEKLRAVAAVLDRHALPPDEAAAEFASLIHHCRLIHARATYVPPPMVS